MKEPSAPTKMCIPQLPEEYRGFHREATKLQLQSPLGKVSDIGGSGVCSARALE